MNLALMSSQKNWGGGEQFLWTLGTELSSRGHHVLWIAPPTSKLFARLEESNSLRFAMSGRHPSPLAMLRFRNALAQYGIEVLHMNDSHAVTWGTVSTLTKTKNPSSGRQAHQFSCAIVGKIQLVRRPDCMRFEIRLRNLP